MRGSIRSMSKNFTGVLAANIMSASVAALAVLVVSKFFDVTNFSYWQLYVFYVSYVGFMHFGWVDGIYLRYGGRQYDELDKSKLGSQFWLLAVLQSVILIIVGVLAVLLMHDTDKVLILILTGVNCLLLNTRAFLQFILLSTNRISTFSTNLIIEKLLYVALIVGVIATGLSNYEYLLIADIFAKLTMLVALCYVCRDIVFIRAHNTGEIIKEVTVNISIGVKLMLANIASLLIVGVIRFAIEHTWGIEKFGKVSLALTAANLVMVFISAVSVVIFPILRRTDVSKLPAIYSHLRSLLMLVVLGALLIYYPAYYLLGLWLPSYADSLVYLALLFPICVYEAKASMLIVTYMKTLRKEKDILMINLGAVFLSVVGVIVSAIFFNSLTLTILVAVMVLAARAMLAEFILSRYIPIKYKRDVVFEVALTSIFILTAWFMGGMGAMAIYAVAYGVYLFIKKRDIKMAIALIMAKK